MSNLTKNIKAAEQMGTDTSPGLKMPVSGGVVIYSGQVLTTNIDDADGHPGSASPVLLNSGNLVLGVAAHGVDNSLGITGAQFVEIHKCVLHLSNSAGSITSDMVGTKCYMEDDHSVTSSVGNAPGKPVAGTVWMVDPNGQMVWVKLVDQYI